MQLILKYETFNVNKNENILTPINIDALHNNKNKEKTVHVGKIELQGISQKS
jgi:hypothetical protein